MCVTDLLAHCLSWSEQGKANYSSCLSSLKYIGQEVYDFLILIQFFYHREVELDFPFKDHHCLKLGIHVFFEGKKYTRNPKVMQVIVTFGK